MTNLIVIAYEMFIAMLRKFKALFGSMVTGIIFMIAGQIFQSEDVFTLGTWLLIIGVMLFIYDEIEWTFRYKQLRETNES